MKTRRRPPVKRDTILFALGVGIVVYQQATGEVTPLLLGYAAAATLAPGTLQLIGSLLGTRGTSPSAPSPSSEPSPTRLD